MADLVRKSIGAQRNPESERAILDAAAELLADTGVAGFSIEAVARRAHAGKPTIYRWWPDKTRLLLAVYARLKDQMVLPDTGSLEGDIAGLLENLLNFWSRGHTGTIFRSVLAESQANAEARQALEVYHATRRTQVAKTFMRDYPGGGLDQDAAERLTEIIVAFGFAQLLLGRLNLDAGELGRVAAILAKGAAATAP